MSRRPEFCTRRCRSWWGLAAASMFVVSTAEAHSLTTRPSSARFEFHIDADVHAEAPAGECPGDGSEASPFRSLDCAFASGSIQPDTILWIHDAATPYGGTSSEAHDLPSTTAAAPVVIQPAPGHVPIFDGPLVLVGLGGWEIYDLVFDGSAGDSPVGDALRINGGGSGDVPDIRVEGVTIRSWPGRGIVLRGTGSSIIQGAHVIGNRIEAAREAGMWVEDTANAEILDNEIAYIVCKEIEFTLCDDCGAGQCAPCGDCLGVPMESCMATSQHDRGHQSGLRVLGDSVDVTIAGNYFHDFLDDDCGPEGTRTAALFITGADTRQGSIHHNIIERIAPGNLDNGYGILMFQSTDEWIVERNALSEIGRCALCEGDDLFYGSQNVQWRHNTVTDVTGAGIDIRWAVGAELRGNLVSNAAGGAVRVWSEGIDNPPAFDHNLYWSATDDTTGRWGDDTALDLSGWQGACGCDDGSAWGDPLLPTAPVDYTPSLDGAAIDLVPALGDGEPETFHGQAYDAGAIEPPRWLEARVEDVASGLIHVTFENRYFSMIGASEDCGGLALTMGEERRGLQSCATEGQAIVVQAAEPLYGNELITLSWEDGAIRASSPFNPLEAIVVAAAVEVVNEAPEFPPDTTSGADGADSSTTMMATSGGSSDDGGLDSESSGCSCNSDGPRPVPAWGLVVLALLGRRRRSSI